MIPLDLSHEVSANVAEGSPETERAALPEPGRVDALVLAFPSQSSDVGLGLKFASGKRLFPGGPDGSRFVRSRVFDGARFELGGQRAVAGEETDLVLELFNDNGSAVRVSAVAEVGVPQLP